MSRCFLWGKARGRDREREKRPSDHNHILVIKEKQNKKSVPENILEGNNATLKLKYKSTVLPGTHHIHTSH